MNAFDLAIIGTVVGFGLIGLKTGLLKPISGIGGLIVGVILAIQFSAELAVIVEQNIDSETVRRIAAFVAIVIIATMLSRVAASLLKKILNTLFLGWVDNVAGAAAGVALGFAVSGTAVFLLTGADLEPMRDALASSELAPEVSKAAVLTSSMPWCSQTDGGSVEAGTCTDIAGVFDQYLGRHISGPMEDILGEDMGSIAEVVQSTLSGASVNTESIMGATDVLVGEGSSALTEAVGGALEGKSAEEIAALVSPGDLTQITQGTVDGILTGTIPQDEEKTPKTQ
ncbi:MAG: CvpA family protein [SAR202 cluster bacterium]|nr:CvpA family protein [SAR202 cluster bacterium]